MSVQRLDACTPLPLLAIFSLAANCVQTTFALAKIGAREAQKLPQLASFVYFFLHLQNHFDKMFFFSFFFLDKSTSFQACEKFKLFFIMLYIYFVKFSHHFPTAICTYQDVINSKTLAFISSPLYLPFMPNFVSQDCQDKKLWTENTC